MHRAICLCAGMVLFTLTISAQKNNDIPEFGKVEKSELINQQCEFDKNAEALVLFDVAEVFCNFYQTTIGDPINTEVERHVRIKILNDKGLTQANIKIPYYSYHNQEQIRNITAQTYNLDASGNIVVTRLEKKNIFNKQKDKKYSEYIFTLPEVKAGSIIEYKYKTYAAGFGGLENWYFQQEIPVAFSRYTIDFPVEFEVRCDNFGTLPMDFRKKETGKRQIQTYIMENIPALRDEPFISCEYDYLQRLQPKIVAVNTPLRRYPLTYTWIQVIKNLMEDEDFGIQLKRNIPRTDDLDNELKNITDPYQKMCIIHRYVRNNMEWNGYSSIWALDGVKSAWKDKKGTSGEINLILVNLLRDAGLNAHPILVSTRENGRVVPLIADYHQFDKVLAHVVIGDKTYVLDGTEKYTPSNLIPYEVMYSEGLVIEKLDTYEWGWITLWNEAKKNKDVVYVAGNISDEGKLEGHATVTSYDYARLKKIPALKAGKDKFLDKYFISTNPGVLVDSLVLENEKVDTLPLIQKVHFSEPTNSSGDYRYFSANLFTGLEKNPFIADTRFSDIFFATNQTYYLVGNFTIPENYSFEALPKSIRMIMPDTSIVLTRRIATEKNKLAIRISLDFRRPFYSINEYPEFKEFYKKLFDILNEQFVIKKNEQSTP